VGIYLKVRDLLTQRGALFLNLTTSFRAVPRIQSAVNAAFRPFMDGNPSTLQAEYVPLSPLRSDEPGQPALVALPVPEPYGYYGITKTAIEESLPEAVAGFAEWLLEESGWSVTERESPEKRVPVSARHICILFRRFESFGGDVTRPYVEALEARGIRHLLVGGRSFHEREEVETIRTALTAVEWPDDELSVFATLRGSLFAIGDGDLLEYRHHFRRLHPFRIPEDEPSENLRPIVEALQLIASLHRRRNQRPIADTVNLLLEATRAHAGFVLRPSGEQALANVLHMAELARDYESTGGISFRGFVERLMEDSDGRRAAQAPILEEGSEGVRIMTVHKAKGLEFPVVILADPTANIARGQAGRFIDSHRRLCAVRIAGWSPGELLEHQEEEVGCDVAEGVRIAYVAATRARDLLVVPSLGDGPMSADNNFSPSSTWIMPLNSAVYPPRENWSRSKSAPGCPRFGKDTVLSRPDEHLHGEGIKPGLHEFSDHDVAWWDPGVLKLKAPPPFGVRQEDLVSKKVDSAIVESDAKRYAEWENGRRETLTKAGTPTLRVQRATERAALQEEQKDVPPAPPVEVVEIPQDPERPGGTLFGSLVLDGDSEQCRRVSELQGRILGAAPREIEAATRTVLNVLEHPLLERARRAAEKGRCRRETPVTLSTEDGFVVDGVVDLAFLEEDTWTAVDFKTDRELERELMTYRRQVGLYVEVIEKATGQKAQAVLMKI
jgi:ATP-dependent exoDNAse (exonuclease V) beta subunit